MKTRRNTKTKRIRENRHILGVSISDRPPEIEDRTEFGHWEIDTVERQKSDDNALLTLVERRTRNYYAILLDDQDHDSANYAMTQLGKDFGDLFPEVFKAISDYSTEAIQLIYQSLNNLTRKILVYQQPAVLFEQELIRLAT